MLCVLVGAFFVVVLFGCCCFWFVCLFSLFFLELSTEPGIRLSGAVCI